jgi:hypothetical protein
MAQRVEINGQPGYADGFKAVLIPGLHEVVYVDDAEPKSVIVTEAGDILAVDSKNVTFVDSPQAAAYRAEWATKADRNPRDVYIPEALR